MSTSREILDNYFGKQVPTMAAEEEIDEESNEGGLSEQSKQRQKRS